MRVHVDSLTVVAPTQGTINESNATSASNGVFYGVITGVARPFREPGVEVPDPLPAGSPCCVPRFDANPERLRVDSDGLVGAAMLERHGGRGRHRPDRSARLRLPHLHDRPRSRRRVRLGRPDRGDSRACAGAGPVHRRLVQPRALLRHDGRPRDLRRGSDRDGLQQPAEQGLARDPQRPADARHPRRRGDGEPLDAPGPGDEDQRRRGRGRRAEPELPGLPRSKGNDIGGIDVGFLVKSPRVT